MYVYDASSTFFIICSVLSALGFWIIDHKFVEFRQTHTKVFLKWLSVVSLIGYLWSTHVIQSMFSLIFVKIAVLSFYSIGDIVIVFSEEKSMLFFLGGHILFSLKYIGTIAMLAIEIGMMFAGLCLLITVVGGYCLHLQHKLGWKKLLFYMFYILNLSFLLTAPFIFGGYIGTLPFVLSDILIGFKVKRFNRLTYPLYYVSLLSLVFLWEWERS